MTVIIREREYEYTSDHPEGWKRAKGDFNFPVLIGSNKCFIKRFNKGTDSISGWQLVESLKGRHERNLPRIHDIVSTKEKGENVNYLFLEFIEGDTLSKLLSEHAEINLEKLTEDLFSAFQSLNKYGFWFADFFEKNVCADARGNFFLVDLDSAQSITKAPDINMWGEKEYWALVFDFCRTILQKQNFKPSHINGVFLNYLQMIFLMLRIKIFNSKRDKEYNEINILSSHLNKISPSFKEIFNKVLESRYPENAQNIILEIKNLIKEKIIPAGGSFSNSEPVIKKFTLNNSEKADDDFIVENGKEFTLNWDVENASDIQLYKNGQFFQKIQQGEESIELAEEVYDREQKKIEFELVASASGNVVRELLSVVVIQSEPIINQFEAKNYFEKNGDNYAVQNERTYILTWDVKNAGNIKLYKNGSLLNELANNKNELELTEKVYDGKSRPIEYTLVASNNAKTDTKSLTVNVKEIYSDAPPVINDFALVGNPKKNGENYYVVGNGKPFKVYWNVENATSVKLYKNKNLYNEYNSAENKIELTEIAEDGKESINQYTLVASNNSAKTDSKTFTIAVEENGEGAMVAEFTLSNYVRKNGDNYVVNNEKPFKLKWHVENVSNLGLLRNGVSYKILNPVEGQLELSEKMDAGKETQIKYTLVATSGSEIKRNSVQVTVKKSGLSPVLIVLGLIMLGIITTFILFHNSKDGIDGKDTVRVTPSTGIIVYPLTKNTILENDTLKIMGQNLPENDNAIQVKFNDDITGKILNHTKDDIDVLVPHLQANNVSIRVNVNDSSFTVANYIPYLRKETNDNNLQLPVVYYLKIHTVNENDILTIFGKYLPGNSVEVRFNDVPGHIVKQTADKVQVEVPLFKNGEVINIRASIEGKTFTVANGMTYKSKVITPSNEEPKVTLNPFNQNTITEGETITIRGNNIPEEKGAVQVIFDGRVYLKIIEQTSTYVRVKVPTLVLKSGILALKANGKYIPLPNSLVFYKLRNQ